MNYTGADAVRISAEYERRAREIPEDFYCWSRPANLLMYQQTLRSSIAALHRGSMFPLHGRRIADIGRIPYLGALGHADDVLPHSDGSPAGQQNSAQRLRAVWGCFSVPDTVRDGMVRAGGPVLLVDDRIDTGWTLTVAAMLLREAGATAVLPLTLAATAG